MNAHEVIRRPIVTEKAVHLSQRRGQYAFEVAPNATKRDVKSALEEIYRHKKLEVLAVRTCAETLAAVRCPVLDLRASDDRVVPAAAGRRLRAAGLAADCVVVAGPHMLLQTRARECADALAAWWDSSAVG